MTYEQMEARLFALARRGMNPGLGRMHRALAALGDPHRCAPVLHVAGSNGKGSVCALLAAACRAAGLRTALYTSPHLERFVERFQVDGEPVREPVLLALHEELRARLPDAFAGPDALTFFELATLLGFAHFARERVDVMVVEVGLGGRLDATNVVDPLVSCIAPVGLEHRDWLGDTLALIAAEKAGIVKAGAPVVVAAQEPEALRVIETAAAERGAPLRLEGRDFALAGGPDVFAFRSAGWSLDGVRVGLRGPHQRGNAAVALAALELAAARGLPVGPEAALRGLRDASWPGRLETVRTRPEVVLDGAHNPPAARALAQAVRQLWPGRRVRLVLGVLQDKDLDALVAELLPVADEVIATSPATPRARSAAEVAGAVARRGGGAEVVEVPLQAVERALARSGAEDVVLVCGSLYLVGEVRAALRGARAGGPGELLNPVAEPLP